MFCESLQKQTSTQLVSTQQLHPTLLGLFKSVNSRWPTQPRLLSHMTKHFHIRLATPKTIFNVFKWALWPSDGKHYSDKGVKKIILGNKYTRTMVVAPPWIYTWSESNNFHNKTYIWSFIRFDCFKTFKILPSTSTHDYIIKRSYT